MGLSTFNDSLAKSLPHHKYLVSHGWAHQQSTPHEAQPAVDWESTNNQVGHPASDAYTSHHYTHPKHGSIGVLDDHTWVAHNTQGKKSGKGGDANALVKHLSKKSMKEEIGFTYELVNEAGKKVFSQAVSHERIGVVLKQVAESVKKHKGTTIKLVEAHLPDGKVMKDRKRMSNLSVMVTMAVEEYNRKKIIRPREKSILENLRTILLNPKKRAKLIAELEQADNSDDTLKLPDLNVGDTLLVGKFKNRAAEIKGFEKDEKGQPVAQTTKGDQKIFKPRIAKLMPGAEEKKAEIAVPSQQA